MTIHPYVFGGNGLVFLTVYLWDKHRSPCSLEPDDEIAYSDVSSFEVSNSPIHQTQKYISLGERLSGQWMSAVKTGIVEIDIRKLQRQASGQDV